jgi:NADH dehydrogenase FAD-containing subunit
VKRYLLGVLAEQGTQIKTMEGLAEIKDGKVVLRNSVTAFPTELDADYVVFAAGVRPNTAFADEFFAAFDKVTKVGDASVPGLIGDALREANAKAWVF